MSKSNKQFLTICFLSLIFAFPMSKALAQNTVYFPQVFFDKKDAAKKLEIGTSTIKGVAFTRQDRAGIYAKKQLANNCLKIVINNVTPPTLLSPANGSKICEPRILK